MERDPTKRRVKPAQNLFDFEDLGESSDDSDFRIEDHFEDSDDSLDSNVDANSSDADSNGGNENISSGSINGESLTEANSIESIKGSHSPKKKQFNPKDALKIMICTVCLGDRSDATNEIIECDNCGVTVHEGCYGVQDSDSVCSTDSPCPTTPWFCDSCKAGLEKPDCELCPNSGGIFKETDVGKWVHLVCALYMPGVAFAEVDKLQNVTLFEMAYSKWGGKSCSLCQDQRFARTGVAVGCDAGMCKTYFHVTCGQREGLLAEAHSEEVDQADPFYAHCKLHTDKNLLRKRRRNWLALQMRSEEMKKFKKDDAESMRIKRRLGKYREKYSTSRLAKVQPWVPTQKMARLLTTSASACRALWLKAELSGADTESWALRQAQVEALSDVHRRWNVQPAFSVEFIGYYIDRNVRVTTMRKQLVELVEENSKLLEEQCVIQEKRDKIIKENSSEASRNQELKNTLKVYHDLITFLCPNKKLPELDLMGRPVLHPSQFLAGGSVPTAAARKAGITDCPIPASGDSPDRTVSDAVTLNNTCGLCCGKQDQHLLAKCDTCHKYYHLGCLNPPLTRMPRKTKLMGWQCSECDKDSDDTDVERVDTEAPRKLRHKDNGNGDSSSVISDQFIKTGSPSAVDDTIVGTSGTLETSVDTPTAGDELEGFRVKKRRREKHHRYSPDTEMRSHKHKHKRSKQQSEQRQSLKICFKSIPHPTGGSSYVATPSVNLTPRVVIPLSEQPTTTIIAGTAVTATTLAVPVHRPAAGQIQVIQQAKQVPKKKEEVQIVCATCNAVGNISNLVRCDECLQGFHFSCLDPPVKKSPKVRGYSWHCANCDPTESD